jgi:translation initiation factor IF-3
LADNSKEARDRAEARFERMKKATQEGQKAKAHYEAEGRAVREKTARLRLLRLAKEAADAAQAASEPTKVKKKPGGKAAKSQA